MSKPRYQDIQAAEIPSVEAGGASVRVMAGTVAGTTGPIKLRDPGSLLDVRLQPGATWVQARGNRRTALQRAAPTGGADCMEPEHDNGAAAPGRCNCCARSWCCAGGAGRPHGLRLRVRGLRQLWGGRRPGAARLRL